MKTFVLCNSDWLSLPTIDHLFKKNILAGIAIPARSSSVLVPALQQIGIPDAMILCVSKADFAERLMLEIREKAVEAVFVLTFPWKIPDSLLALLPGHFVNFHFGRLPEYKGADPVFWEIRNGEKNGEITAHVVTSAIDEGPVVLARQLPIVQGITYGMHCKRLGLLASEMVPAVFSGLQAGKSQKQTGESPGRFYKAPSLEQLTIRWKEQRAEDIECLVNASNPKYGGAVTSIRGMRVQLLEVAFADIQAPPGSVPGTIIYADVVYGVIVACLNNQYLQVRILHASEGYLSGSKLFSLGFKAGDVFV